MTSQFHDSTKQIADKLIAVSMLLDTKMETWANVFTRHPDSQNVGVCAGFLSNQDSVNRIEVLIDVQTPSDITTGLLRTRAIETLTDENGDERFNNIALEYTTDRTSAQQLVEKGASVTREDIKQLLHDSTSKLDSLVISDMSGKDGKSQQLLGKRYAMVADELATTSEATEKELVQAMDTVLAKLQQTAASEAK